MSGQVGTEGFLYHSNIDCIRDANIENLVGVILGPIKVGFVIVILQEGGYTGGVVGTLVE